MTTIKDPVCGMEIDPKSAFATREHMGQTYYFYSKNCVEQFNAAPPLHDHIRENRI